VTTPAKTSAQRVFAARLAGLPVFDPNGEPVGKVRDIAVALRSDDQPPRVLGIVLEVQRRPIFVPMGRVARLDGGQVVLATGTVSLQRYEQRAGETLVIAELLDRKITVRESGAQMTVVDIAMEPTRTRDWQLVRVAVRGSRRRSGIRSYDWSDVEGFALPETEQGAANLLAAFEKLRPADLATVLRDLSVKRRGEVAAALDDETLADVLEELNEDDQVAILSGLETERAADVLEAMDPDDAADLLGELPSAEQERLLELMEPGEAAPVRRLLTYEDDTAGGIMTSEPLILPPNATVAEALAHIRNPDLSPALAAQVYVVRPPFETPTGKLLGTVHFQRLLREPPGTLVAACTDEAVTPIETSTSLRDITAHFATYNLVAAPVVDDVGRLLGAVTVDDVLDHLLPDDWRGREHG
jgi:Mg/Co/Ni transporter MgtE